MLACTPLPWPYLWIDFKTKGTYGLYMTKECLENYKLQNFKKSFKKWYLFVRTKKFPTRMPFPSLDAFSFLQCIFPSWMSPSVRSKNLPPRMPLQTKKVSNQIMCQIYDKFYYHYLHKIYARNFLSSSLLNMYQFQELFTNKIILRIKSLWPWNRGKLYLPKVSVQMKIAQGW